MFGGGETRVVKANEEITSAREAKQAVSVSRVRQIDTAKILLGLNCNGHRHPHRLGYGYRRSRYRHHQLIQMVFQNPFDTLNPSHTVGSQIVRTLERFVGNTPNEREDRMLELLDLIKLPRAFAKRMPRQLSGSQKQRIGVARAFAAVVVADEPVSALDVSVQAAVTELLMDIQRASRTTMLFISHDLSVVRYIADRVVVMYLGHIVEQGTTEKSSLRPIILIRGPAFGVPIADTKVVKAYRVGRRHSVRHEPAVRVPVPDPLPAQKQRPRGQMRDRPKNATLSDGHRIKCHLADDYPRKWNPLLPSPEQEC